MSKKYITGSIFGLIGIVLIVTSIVIQLTQRTHTFDLLLWVGVGMMMVSGYLATKYHPDKSRDLIQWNQRT